MSRRVLITDGDERSALASVRSLGRAGHEVHVVAPRADSLAAASRHVAGRGVVPSPGENRDGFVRAVREHIERWGVDLLLPMTEASLHALLPARDEFPGVQIPGPDHETFRRICDKARVLRVAREAGIAVPDQVRVEGKEEIAGLSEQVTFPAIVKPTRSLVSSDGGFVKTSVCHVSNPEELAQALSRLPVEAFPALVQERITGAGTGVFLLIWDGEVLAAFCHRRLREKPPSGGVSVLRESVPLEESLLRSSRDLLWRFDWKGVAMVEFKRDTRSGNPYLMEVNGRFWGSLQLAIDAGVDFPRLLVEAATGASPEPVTDYKIGVRTRWLLGDVDHLLQRVRRSRRELSLSDDVPGRAGAVADFLTAFGPGTRNEVFRWDDPKPAMRESASWLRAFV